MHRSQVTARSEWLCPESRPWCVQGIANRDLKLENLLLDRDGHDGTRPLLKICDFGYSKVGLASCPHWKNLILVLHRVTVFCLGPTNSA